MAGGRWTRAGLGAVALVALSALAWFTVVLPLRQHTQPDVAASTDPRAPRGAASLAPHTEAGPPGSPPRAHSRVPDPSGVPMPVGDLPGWNQVFTDDFDRTTLGPDWDAYTGQPDHDPGGYFDPSRVSVGGGLLTIGAWPDPSRGGIYASGGVSNRSVLSQTYGRYDIRFRMDLGTGIAYALLLWPKDNQYPPEIDIAEDNGRDRRTMYTATHPVGGKPIIHSVGGDFTQWHTAGLEWTPRKLVFTLDGQPFATVEGAAVPSEPMALALQTQAWYCGHDWEACPDASTPPRVNLEVDWVVVYAREA